VNSARRIASKFIYMTQETRICVPVCEGSLVALQTAVEAAAQIGDLVEIRLDCLDGIEFERATKSGLEGLAKSLLLPSIFTFRPSEEGGHRAADYATRYAFWSSQQPFPSAKFFDIEHDVVVGFVSANSTPLSRPDWSGVICSTHDFVAMPDNLTEIYEQMANTPAQIVKIAVQANDITDCVPMFQLLDRARNEGREIIALAMGNAGIATRILGPSRGAFLTYGSLESEKATAPGQITAEQLRSIYRIHKINEQTLICGLVGMPAMHSVSPHAHNAAFDASNVNGVYIPFEVRDVASFFTRMVHPRTREIDWKIRGLSITAPHKATVMDCLDWIEPTAKAMGAVNTVVVEASGLFGYNTDAEGLIEPLTRKIGLVADTRIALIGAGGAARAAVWVLREQKANVTIFARDLKKGRSFAEQFRASCRPLEGASFADYDIVINATPLGSAGEMINQSPATADQLGGARLVYDLVYNPTDTKLLREARKAGCETLGGLEMLIAQAGRQFKLWTGDTADQSVMHSAASHALRARV
jgi:3-dehydroquinate dehydratase/shikimate dehydrogenase